MHLHVLCGYVPRIRGHGIVVELFLVLDLIGSEFSSSPEIIKLCARRTLATLIAQDDYLCFQAKVTSPPGWAIGQPTGG